MRRPRTWRCHSSRSCKRSRSLLEALPVETRVELSGSNVADLIPLLPGLFEAPRPADRREVDAETERYRLFEAVTSLLVGLARHAPVLLVLDDLHWTRRPTVQLLDHLLRATRLTQVCVVVTYGAPGRPR